MLLVRGLQAHQKAWEHVQATANAQEERYAVSISVRTKLVTNMLGSIVPLKDNVSQRCLCRMINHST